MDTLSTFDIRRMLQAVRDQHALAYGWQAPDDISRITAGLPADRPLRTVIRTVVEYLDLQFLYGGRQEVAAEMPEELLPGELPEDEGQEQEKIQNHEYECL